MADRGLARRGTAAGVRGDRGAADGAAEHQPVVRPRCRADGRGDRGCDRRLGDRTAAGFGFLGGGARGDVRAARRVGASRDSRHGEPDGDQRDARARSGHGDAGLRGRSHSRDRDRRRHRSDRERRDRAAARARPGPRAGRDPDRRHRRRARPVGQRAGAAADRRVPRRPARAGAGAARLGDGGRGGDHAGRRVAGVEPAAPSQLGGGRGPQHRCAAPVRDHDAADRDDPRVRRRLRRHDRGRPPTRRRSPSSCTAPRTICASRCRRATSTSPSRSRR